jgi:hypothetical protein
MPVVSTGRTIRATGVSAEGILCASAVSIWCRIAEAEFIAGIFVLYSPMSGVGCQTVIAPENVQMPDNLIKLRHLFTLIG